MPSAGTVENLSWPAGIVDLAGAFRENAVDPSDVRPPVVWRAPELEAAGDRKDPTRTSSSALCGIEVVRWKWVVEAGAVVRLGCCSVCGVVDGAAESFDVGGVDLDRAWTLDFPAVWLTTAPFDGAALEATTGFSARLADETVAAVSRIQTGTACWVLAVWSFDDDVVDFFDVAIAAVVFDAGRPRASGRTTSIGWTAAGVAEADAR